MFEERFVPVAHLLTDFEKRLMNDCLKKLDAHDDALRFNSFATPFRELIRVILHRLAPDEEVLKCNWYTVEADKITRRQRVIYAIKGGLDDEFIQGELGINITEVTSNLGEAISNLNKLTHINESYYDMPYDEALKMAFNATDFLVRVLSGINETRIRIIDAYEIRLNELITSAAIEDVIDEIDILATHYWIDDIQVEQIDITEITSTLIHIEVKGNIDVTHQYGSDRDVSEGNGIHSDGSYPFTIKTHVDVADPLEVTITTDDLQVDNSSHFDDGDDVDNDENYEPGVEENAQIDDNPEDFKKVINFLEERRKQ